MSLADMVSATLITDYAVPVVDEEINRQRDLPNFREEGLHPSEVAGVCPRMVVLNRILKIPKFQGDNILQRIWNDGHSFHGWYQNRYFGSAGVLYGEWVCSRCKRVVEGFMPEDSCTCQTEPDRWPGWVPDYCKEHCYDTVTETDCTGLDLMSRPAECRNMVAVEKRGGCVWCGQNNQRAWGEWLYNEPRIWIPELGLVGKCDGLLYINGHWYVLEIKTINTRGFQFLKGPSEKYLGQGATYHYAFKQMPEPYSLAEAVLFFYINKNEAPHSNGKQRKEKEFPIYWSEESEKVIEGIREMKSAMENHYLPPMLHTCSQTRRNRKCDRWEQCSMIMGEGKLAWAAAEKMRDALEVGDE